MKKTILMLGVMFFLFYGINTAGAVESGSGAVIIIADEGINKEVFDDETLKSIMEIEGIIMVLMLVGKFWYRIIDTRAKNGIFGN